MKEEPKDNSNYEKDPDLSEQERDFWQLKFERMYECAKRFYNRRDKDK